MITKRPAILCWCLQEILETYEDTDAWIVPQPQGLTFYDASGKEQTTLKFWEVANISQDREIDWATSLAATLEQPHWHEMFFAAEEVIATYVTLMNTDQDSEMTAAIQRLRRALQPLYTITAAVTPVDQHDRDARIRDAAAEVLQTDVVALLRAGQRNADGMVSLFVADDVDETVKFSVTDRQAFDALWTSIENIPEGANNDRTNPSISKKP